MRYASHNSKPNPPSAISLKGRWLETSGFITEMPVTVTGERGNGGTGERGNDYY
ncbi:type I toxin-antitoxin system SymE family toxin [Pectobacterium carotovorum]|uniref:type I toxin-antitoxin system SymE family toxin n=1 Tax=Pectobacterium carotovorum TaxID=554 RepID=UPI0021C2C5D6